MNMNSDIYYELLTLIDQQEQTITQQNKLIKQLIEQNIEAESIISAALKSLTVSEEVNNGV